MLRCLLLLWFVAAYGLPAACGQGVAPRPRALNTSDGLVNNAITSIVQDRQGFLWLGTQDGLSRYDGSVFRTFRADARRPGTLVGNFVRSVAADPVRGGLWIGTGSGLCRYEPRTEQFAPIPIDYPAGTNYFVHAVLADPQGRVWAGTEDGVLCYQPGRSLRRLRCPSLPSAVPSSRTNSIQALAREKSGVMWAGTGEGFLYRTASDGAALELEARYTQATAAAVTAIAAAPRGGLWVGTIAGGLRYLPPAPGLVVEVLRPRPGAPAVHSICADPTGAWVGSATGLRYFPLPGAPRPPTGEVLKGTVLSLFAGRDGQFWVGTEAGLQSLDIRPSPFRLPVPLASTGPVWAVGTQKASLWLGTELNGVLRLNPATGALDEHLLHNPTDTSSLAENFVRAVLADHDGGLWVGTQRQGLDYRPPGASHFRHFRHQPSRPGSLADNSVRSLYRDPADGSLWVGTEGGLCRLADAQAGRFLTYRHDPKVTGSLPNYYVRCVLRDRSGRLWVGTGGGGLCRLDDPETGRFTAFRTDEQNEHSLPSNFVRALSLDARGRLWVGTEGGGICRLDNPRTGRFTTVGEAQGLPSDVVYGLQADSASRTLWASTNRGLVRLDPETGRFTTFDLRDGVPMDDYNAGAAGRGPDGRLYFGGPGGLVGFQPAGLALPSAPRVLLTGLRRLNRPVSLPDTALSQRRLLRIGPEDYVFSLEFTALDLRRAGRYPLLYQLEGFDPDWLAAGPHREATYTNLDPGHYTFRVRGADAPEKSGVALRLVVEPAWYATWWFRLLAVAAVVGAGWLAYRLRVQQLLTLERVRHRIARDLHDDMGSTLSSISILSQLARNHQKNERPAQAATLLEQIGDSSRRMLDSMDDIVWAINPAHDGLAGVTARMRAFASEVLEARGVELRFTSSPNIAGLRLPMEARREFFLIFKEAVNNLAKYAQAGHATIEVSYAHRCLQLLVQDDGVGFDQKAPARGGGNGLTNMRSRAEALRGQLSIDTAPGQGTTLRLRVPM
ncbi:two-component regulator propeller domain-containing protein [Hymenobacter saemangeumensis]|uniref:Oxygen sensor histidine kinase NreB n=1 Tax=Hymenobacter saemangeumensis TaxID=1084522 RepID=A0ABP8IE25_9BACT